MPNIPILKSKKYAGAAAFTATVLAFRDAAGFMPDDVLFSITLVWVLVIVSNFVQNITEQLKAQPAIVECQCRCQCDCIGGECGFDDSDEFEFYND